ncbi:MAG: ATP synthase F0 subunit C [Coriobacteriales bacterium]|nr:ATP synthase F0 subunit C [Coriobacteriales bacterium]
MEELALSGIALDVVGFGLSAIGGGVGVGLAGLGATQAIARQPEMYSRIFTVFIMAAAMAEALGLLGFVLTFIS